MTATYNKDASEESEGKAGKTAQAAPADKPAGNATLTE
jgi:hypothetical protein